MRVTSVNATYSNNYQNPSHRKSDVNFRGDLSATADEYNAYFRNKENLGYEREKYKIATDKILYEYSPLALFSWSGKGICIGDKIKENPKSSSDFEYLTSYYSLDDIINRREEIELNLINVRDKECDYYVNAEFPKHCRQCILAEGRRYLIYAQEFFDSNPQLLTDKIKTRLEETLGKYEKIPKELRLWRSCK